MENHYDEIYFMADPFIPVLAAGINCFNNLPVYLADSPALQADRSDR